MSRKIANIIKDKLNCDILELNPVVDYSTDYQKVVDEEQSQEGSNHMPEIKDINVNLDNYDTIIIGTVLGKTLGLVILQWKYLEKIQKMNGVNQ